MLVVRLVLLQVCHFPIVAAFSIHSVYDGIRGDFFPVLEKGVAIILFLLNVGAELQVQCGLPGHGVNSRSSVAVTSFRCFDQFEFGPA